MLRWSTLAAFLSAVGCGRVGYDTFTAVDADIADGGLDGVLLEGAPIGPPADAAAREDEAGLEGGVDAPTADVATDGPYDLAIPTATLCSSWPDALYCEDFEGSLPGAVGDYQGLTPGGTLQIVTGAPGRGGGVLRASADPQTAFPAAFLRRVLSPPVTSGRLHFRAFVSLPTGYTIAHWLGLFHFGKNMDYEKSGFSLLPSDQAQLTVLMANPRSAAGSVPRGRWMCVELVLEVAATGGWGEVFIDGTRLLRVDAPSLPAGGYAEIQLGITHARGATGDPVVLMDDVVVANRAIGCD